MGGFINEWRREKSRKNSGEGWTLIGEWWSVEGSWGVGKMQSICFWVGIYIYVCMYVKFVSSWRRHKWVTLALTWQPKHPWKENRDLLRSCKTRVRFPLRVTGGEGSDQIILLKFWVGFYLGTLLLGTPGTLKLKSILYKINWFILSFNLQTYILVILLKFIICVTFNFCPFLFIALWGYLRWISGLSISFYNARYEEGNQEKLPLNFSNSSIYLFIFAFIIRFLLVFS